MEELDFNIELGFISKEFESRGDSSTVSAGVKDPGGTSYGSYQLSSTKGRVTDFLEHMKQKGGLAKQAAEEFEKIAKSELEQKDGILFDFGNKSATAAKWKEMSRNEKLDLDNLEFEYIKKTHYDPALKHAEKLGFDIDNDAIKEMIWSGSVQHKGINKILNEAISKDPLKKETIEEQISNFYEKRKNYIENLPDDKLPEETKKNILSRYQKEEEKVLNYNKSNKRILNSILNLIEAITKI
tara:strand:- start:1158 stop:1880 length:723 start_codon:yes stop_codon:yes gene_type:complete